MLSNHITLFLFKFTLNSEVKIKLNMHISIYKGKNNYLNKSIHICLKLVDN